ncbi:MAG: HAD-IA family hydrolase [Candidatus Moraniibacteriota bacterium]|nr:MAG: HAD-IA family hydrolase [Candidatus Moranbacteria bacterium]
MKSLDLVILVDAVHTFIIEDNENFSVSEEMFALLEKFPQRKILLTGADDNQYKKFGLDAVPYEVFTMKHHPEKTDPTYFHTFLETFGLKPDQVIYFEHDKEAVKSAESVGIKTYFYNSKERDLKSLEEFLRAHLK